MYFAIQCCMIALNLYCVTAYDGVDFNIHDILNAQMMPLSIFFYGFNPNISQNYVTHFVPALHMMNYHR